MSKTWVQETPWHFDSHIYSVMSLYSLHLRVMHHKNLGIPGAGTAYRRGSREASGWEKSCLMSSARIKSNRKPSFVVDKGYFCTWDSDLKISLGRWLLWNSRGRGSVLLSHCASWRLVLKFVMQGIPIPKSLNQSSSPVPLLLLQYSVRKAIVFTHGIPSITPTKIGSCPYYMEIIPTEVFLVCLFVYQLLYKRICSQTLAQAEHWYQ